MHWLIAQASQPSESIVAAMATFAFWKPLIGSMLTVLTMDVRGYVTATEEGKAWNWKVTRARLLYGLIIGLALTFGFGGAGV